MRNVARRICNYNTSFGKENGKEKQIKQGNTF